MLTIPNNIGGFVLLEKISVGLFKYREAEQ
jgi:hypothetical protein